MKCSAPEWILVALFVLSAIPVFGYVWIMFLAELRRRFWK